MRRPRDLNLPDSGAETEGERRSAPSAERNLEPIAQVLDRHVPTRGRVLELASGTGQHISAFALRFPGVDWQPSDASPDNLTSIRAWATHVEAQNLRDPIVLDAARSDWSEGWHVDLVLLVNLLHLISDDEADTVLAETARALAPGGRFALYGPFRRNGHLVSEGDKRFDASLRAQDARIGYKDIESVTARLQEAGLEVIELVEMPADNLLLVTRRP